MNLAYKVETAVMLKLCHDNGLLRALPEDCSRRKLRGSLDNEFSTWASSNPEKVEVFFRQLQNRSQQATSFARLDQSSLSPEWRAAASQIGKR